MSDHPALPHVNWWENNDHPAQGERISLPLQRDPDKGLSNWFSSSVIYSENGHVINQLDQWETSKIVPLQREVNQATRLQEPKTS